MSTPDDFTAGDDGRLNTLPAPDVLLRDHADLWGGDYADVVRRAADLQVRAWADETRRPELFRQLDPLSHTARDLLLAAGAESTQQAAQDKAGLDIRQVALSRWRTGDRPPPGGDRA